jgi:acylpyruvate hydrolase
MQLFTYQFEGKERAARRIGTQAIDLNLAVSQYFQSHRSRTAAPRLETLLDVFSNSGLLEYAQQATDWVFGHSSSMEAQFRQNGVIFSYEQAEMLAPVPVPGKVICIAGNYPAPNKLEKPDFPIVFLKPSSGVSAHQQPVILPKIAANAAYEVELAVIIGKSGRNLTNEIGDRMLEKRTSQWTSGKMFDTFTPMGPVLITPDELADFRNLNMITRVNGEIVQKGSTADMFFDVPHLISILSELTTLRRGDVILTGSPKLMDGQPAPVVSLKPGDLLQVSIENLGTLANTILAESQASA